MYSTALYQCRLHLYNFIFLILLVTDPVLTEVIWFIPTIFNISDKTTAERDYLVENPGHEGLGIHIHHGPGLVVVLAELLDPVGGEPGPLSLLQHVVSGVHPPVSAHLLQRGTSDGSLLEDPHEQPGPLHGALLVEVLELEPHLEDVVLGLLGRLALEGQLAGHEDVEEDTEGPDVGLGVGLGLLNDLRSGVVKVVGSLDLSAATGHGLGGLKVGDLHLDRSAERPAGADENVGGLQVEVDLAAPVDVLQGVQHLSGNVADQVLSVGRPLSNEGENIGGGEGAELQQGELVSLESVHQGNHLLVTEGLQVLELPHGGLVALTGGLVEALDGVDLAFLVNIGSHREATLGQLVHEVERSRILTPGLQWFLLTLVRERTRGVLDVLSGLDLLEDVVELSSGGSAGRSHHNAGGN